jgi:hypothetical protein
VIMGRMSCKYLIFKAGDGTRTRDLLITNQLLYQLSYASVEVRMGILSESGENSIKMNDRCPILVS